MRAQALRWDLVLPAVAGVVALVLLGLAATAAGALRERQALVAEGRLLRLAHDLERELRNRGPGAAETTLVEALTRESGFVMGLRVLDQIGDPEITVGVPIGSDDRSIRRVDLFLGPAWRWTGGGLAGPSRRGQGGGRRVLEVALAPGVLRPPAVARLLLPAAFGAALVLLTLGVLGGRHLVRHRDEERRTAERQRLEGLARAGAGLAHQLRTPLAIVKGSCQLLLEEASEGADPTGSARRLHTVLEQSERMDRLLAHLLDFARPPEAEPQSVELAPALEAILDRLQVPGRSRERVVLEAPPGLRAHVDPDHLALVVENLVTNALAFSPAESPVVVRAQAKTKRGGAARERVEISVVDRGSGPGDDPERWFEPYVTTRADGTGLGLPIARALAAANQGRLTLEAAPEGGTRARWTLVRDRSAERGDV